MSTELVVVWNGAHKNCDADLLFAGIRRDAVGEEPRHEPVRVGMAAKVRQHLPTDPARAMTTRELMEATGYTLASVNSALFQLRRKGLLSTAVQSDAVAREGRPRQVYWTVAA